jgi:hypothetical protein
MELGSKCPVVAVVAVVGIMPVVPVDPVVAVVAVVNVDKFPNLQKSFIESAKEKKRRFVQLQQQNNNSLLTIDEGIASTTKHPEAPMQINP